MSVGLSNDPSISRDEDDDDNDDNDNINDCGKKSDGLDSSMSRYVHTSITHREDTGWMDGWMVLTTEGECRMCAMECTY